MISCIKGLFRSKKSYNEVISSDSPFSYNLDTEELKNFIYKWDSAFPIDKWYRDKYKLRFNSSEHRNTSFIDMFFEYNEVMIFQELRKENDYIPNEGNFLNKNKEEKVLTLEDVKKEFAQIDLSQFDD